MLDPSAHDVTEDDAIHLSLPESMAGSAPAAVLTNVDRRFMRACCLDDADGPRRERSHLDAEGHKLDDRLPRS